MKERRAIQIVLITFAAALLILGLSAAAMILWKVDTISLLLLSATCSINGFLLFALASRQFRIESESNEADRDLKSKPRRKDSESTQASRDLALRLAAPRVSFLNFAWIGLLLLGLASAIVIFLAKTGWWHPDRNTMSLWFLFVPSMLLGELAALLAQEEVMGQTAMKKKQVCDEGCGTSRQSRTRRRGAVFIWRS